MTITTKVVTKPIPETLNLKAVNWENFKDTVCRNMENITIQEIMSINDIDNKLGEWYQAIEDGLTS